MGPPISWPGHLLQKLLSEVGSLAWGNMKKSEHYRLSQKPDYMCQIVDSAWFQTIPLPFFGYPTQLISHYLMSCSLCCYHRLLYRIIPSAALIIPTTLLQAQIQGAQSYVRPQRMFLLCKLTVLYWILLSYDTESQISLLTLLPSSVSPWKELSASCHMPIHLFCIFPLRYSSFHFQDDLLMVPSPWKLETSLVSLATHIYYYVAWLNFFICFR